MSSSTATASRGRTSSRRIAGLPNRASSSAATAYCCREALTEDVLANKLEPEHWTIADWARHRARGDINRLLPLLRAAARAVAQASGRQSWQGVRGCNFAFLARDLERVDGFETSFTGWGLEDSDHRDPADPRRRAAQGRALCHRRAASVASGGRPLAPFRQSGAARRAHQVRSRACAERPFGAGASARGGARVMLRALTQDFA